MFKDFITIEKTQFYQEKAGEVILKIVKNSMGVPDLQKIKELFHNRYGNNLDIQIIFVDDIPRTKVGKYKYFDQRIKTITSINCST